MKYLHWQLIIVSDFKAFLGYFATTLTSNRPSLLSLTNLTSLLSSTLFMLKSKFTYERVEREIRIFYGASCTRVHVCHLQVMFKCTSIKCEYKMTSHKDLHQPFVANVVYNKSYFNDNFGSGYTLKALHLICWKERKRTGENLWMSTHYIIKPWPRYLPPYSRSLYGNSV